MTGWQVNSHCSKAKKPFDSKAMMLRSFFLAGFLCAFGPIRNIPPSKGSCGSPREWERACGFRSVLHAIMVHCHRGDRIPFCVQPRGSVGGDFPLWLLIPGGVSVLHDGEYLDGMRSMVTSEETFDFLPTFETIVGCFKPASFFPAICSLTRLGPCIARNGKNPTAAGKGFVFFSFQR